MAASKAPGARGVRAVLFLVWLCLGWFSRICCTFSTGISWKRRQGIFQLGLASGFLDMKDAKASRLVKDRGELVIDPQTGQCVLPPCQKVCKKECLAIVGIVNDKNIAYCERRCEDDCAAGDGFGSTESYSEDNELIARDAEKSPGERFAEWGVEMNAQMLDSFMKMPGAKPGLQPDSLSAMGDDLPQAAKTDSKPIFDARDLFRKK
ncbi:unnamed protein product [Symbiodinium pilosum]|uniref:Uncharacterized protein n=1 Tax=Symbiodinium pilosum TaxID=2952 RepID=A0A812W2I5_SYMPI|nr:unnamed protein product [Symbiodinium pilosum]